MPTLDHDHDYRNDRRAVVKAKLARLGIDPRSRKYDKLYFRMMRR